MSEFETAFARFLEEQQMAANPRRRERLQGDLNGEKKMLQELWPVFRSFEGFTLEMELVSLTGVRVYVDAFYAPARLCFESEGYVAHAEKITRDRFDFEKMKVRTIALYRYVYVPFTWDELDKKAESCRRFVYGMLGRQAGDQLPELSIYERELIRFAVRLGRPFRVTDVCEALDIGLTKGRALIRSLLDLELIKPSSAGTVRLHVFEATEKAYALAGI